MFNPYFPLRRIILLLIMLSLHLFSQHPLESTAVILSVMCLSWNEINCCISGILVSFDDLNFNLHAELQRCLGIYILLYHSRQARYHFAISYHEHCNHAYIYLSMLFIISVGISS